MDVAGPWGEEELSGAEDLSIIQKKKSWDEVGLFCTEESCVQAAARAARQTTVNSPTPGDCA